MSRRGNAVAILGTLIADALIICMWYVTLFPVEPVTTLETIFLTIAAMFFTVLMAAMNYVVYMGCIVDDS